MPAVLNEFEDFEQDPEKRVPEGRPLKPVVDVPVADIVTVDFELDVRADLNGCYEYYGREWLKKFDPKDPFLVMLAEQYEKKYVQYLEHRYVGIENA